MYGYNQPLNVDVINQRIQELERMKSNMPSNIPTNLTQNFQLAPQSNQSIKYVSCDEDVKKELVYTDTLFINKEHTNLWIKDITGCIKKYELTEICEKDDKDLKIDKLEARLKEMEEKLSAKPINANAASANEEQKSTII